MRRLIVMLVAVAIGSVVVPCPHCSVAYAAVAANGAAAADLKGGNTPTTQKQQAGVDRHTLTIAPVDSSELPTLPGAGERARNNRILHTRLVGLSRRNDPALQFGQGRLWLNHTDQGGQGVGVSVRPLSQAAQRLAIYGVYIDHAADSVAAGQKNAWSLALDSRWLGERLTLHGEYAQSWKSNGAWSSLPEPNSAQAYALLASYAGRPHMLASQPLAWRLSLDWQQAGRAFWSPTAAGVARDKAVAQVAADIRWGQFDSHWSFASATNNVADDPGVATLSMHTVTADLRYTDREAIDPSGLGRLFAAPSYALYLEHERSSLDHAPAGGSASIPDRFTDTASLRVRFTPEPWWWELSYTHSMHRVLGQQTTRMASNQTRLDLHLPLSDWLQLTPTLQWSLINGQSTDNEIRTITGTLGGRASLIPRRLAAKLHLRARRRYRSKAAEHETVAVESSLNWTLWSPQYNGPNVTISLRGSARYADNMAPSAGGPVQYQAFSGIQLSWPKPTD
ncbi:MAG: hypothetical protein L0H73_14225 [Nitrococcus sp.]|nr:hypothetical protein [Nitrococcus sp.]